ITAVIENGGTKNRQSVFPSCRALDKSPDKLFNRREHQEFFAHLLNEGNPLDTELQGDILAFCYSDQLSDSDRGEEKDHDIYNVMGMVHGEAVSRLGEEKIKGEQADNRGEQ